MVETFYYNFVLEGKHAGHYELSFRNNEIWQFIKFTMPDGSIYEQNFGLKTSASEVIAYKYGKSSWQDLTAGSGLYPTSAFPVLVPAVDDRLAYTAINEASGEVLGETVLIREDNVVTEHRNDQLTRKFWLQGDKIVKIDWGGAVSGLCKTFEEACP